MRPGAIIKPDRPKQGKLVTYAFVLSCTLFGAAWMFSLRNAVASELSPGPETPAEEPQTKDYSRFTHSNPYHSRLPCLICHRRDDNSTRISFPGGNAHLPCAGCHGLQFSDNTSPICTICHTNPQTGAMKRFPGLRSFGAKFNHSRHQRVACSVCHTSARRGVALSIPAGSSAHSTCFRCHTSSTPHTMSSCSVCHQPGRLVRTSTAAKAFNVNFSHARHMRGTSLSCASCHTVRAGSARGRQVSAPLASMHFAPARTLSCAACHNGTRAFGANDFSNCKRCHIGNSFRF
jgi:c(7)-type cytochrome triheme protein